MPKTDYRIVRNNAQLDNMVSVLKGAPELALDLETQSLMSGAGQIVGWALSAEERTGWYIPVGHDVGEQLDYQHVVERMQELLDTVGVVGMHNAKFDTRFLRDDGIVLPDDRVVDTMLAVYVSAEGHSRFGLKELADKLFAYKMVEFSDLFPKKVKEKRIASVPIEIAGEYAAADADVTFRLMRRYLPMAAKRPRIWAIESALWPVVRELEDTGARVARRYIEASADYLQVQADVIERVIWDQYEEAIGERWEFSMAKPAELRTALFDKLGVPVVGRTATGLPSTEESVLARSASSFPIVANILKYRSVKTTMTQMAKTLIDAIREDGRVHTDYRQTGATTGRFSSSNPNLQNITKGKGWNVDTPEGRLEFSVNPRASFIASSGHYLIELDFRQIEFIVMASLAGARSVIDAYAEGRDTHRQTYADVMQVPVESVTESQRNAAKTWNFLIIYGGSADALSGHTGQSKRDAEEAMARFFAARPEFRRFIDLTIARAEKTHRVSTYWGRDQHIPEYDIAGPQARSKARRAAVNRVIQGTAADIQKLGLIRTVRSVPPKFPGARLILQTHDSQTWEVPWKHHPDDIIPALVEAMAPTVGGPFPALGVDAKVGISWGHLRKFESGVDWDWRGMQQEWLDSLTQLEAAASHEVEYAPDLPVQTTVEVIEVSGVQGVEQARWVKGIVAAYPGERFVRVRLLNDVVELRDRTSLTAAQLASLTHLDVRDVPAVASSDGLAEVVGALTG